MSELLSPRAIAVEKLRRMCALSATFRGGKTYDQAFLKTFKKNVDGSIPRPYACVGRGASMLWKSHSGGDHEFLIPSGSVFLFLSRDTNPDFYEDRIAAEEDADNWFGLVVSEIAALSGADDPESFDGSGHLVIQQINEIGFGENDDGQWSSMGRFYSAGYLVEWGVEA